MGEQLFWHEYLEKNKKQKQFYPHSTGDDFSNNKTLYAAHRHGKVIGILGLWDQSRYKQIAITRLPPLIDQYLALHNRMRNLLRKKPYPRRGDYLSQLFISDVVIEENDPQVFALLLTQAYNDMTVRNEHDLLIVGLHERDTLLRGLKNFRKIKYFSDLYLIFWDEGEDFVKRINPHLIPYLEVGSM